MAQVRVVATMSRDDLEQQVEGNRIYWHLNSLWREGEAQCLKLGRVPGQARSASFLSYLSTIEGFEPGHGHAWVLISMREGKCWRSKQAGDEVAPPGRVSRVMSSRLEIGCWGVHNPELETSPTYLLMLQPWGPHALVLAQMVASSGTLMDERGCSPVEAPNCPVQCSLCGRVTTVEGMESGPCLFHPGQ